MFFATIVSGTDRFTSDNMENCRIPKGQPDGRRLKGQPTWVQASTQILLSYMYVDLILPAWSAPPSKPKHESHDVFWDVVFQ